jgi:hypothetical protein
MNGSKRDLQGIFTVCKKGIKPLKSISRGEQQKALFSPDVPDLLFHCKQIAVVTCRSRRHKESFDKGT